MDDAQDQNLTPAEEPEGSAADSSVSPEGVASEGEEQPQSDQDSTQEGSEGTEEPADEGAEQEPPPVRYAEDISTKPPTSPAPGPLLHEPQPYQRPEGTLPPAVISASRIRRF